VYIETATKPPQESLEEDVLRVSPSNTALRDIMMHEKQRIFRPSHFSSRCRSSIADRVPSHKKHEEHPISLLAPSLSSLINDTYPFSIYRSLDCDFICTHPRTTKFITITAAIETWISRHSRERNVAREIRLKRIELAPSTLRNQFFS